MDLWAIDARVGRRLGFSEAVRDASRRRRPGIDSTAAAVSIILVFAGLMGGLSGADVATDSHTRTGFTARRDVSDGRIQLSRVGAPPPTPTLGVTATATPMPGPIATPAPMPTQAPIPTLAPTPVLQPTPAPVPQLAPIRAYYYLWWSAQHWTDKLGPTYPYAASPWPLPATADADGCNPVSLYSGNQLLDVPPTLLDQDASGVIEADILLARSAGLTGFLLNWGGNGSATQQISDVTYTRRLNEAFAASNRVGGVSHWISYKASSMPSPAFIIGDLTFLANAFAGQPSWEHRDGKPVLVLTGSRNYGDADLATITGAVRDRFYLVGDESYQTLTPARLAMFDALTYYWSTQDPWGNPASFTRIAEMGAMVHAAGKPWIAPFAAGYDSILLGGSTCVPRRGGETMRALFHGNAVSAPDGWALISWNEIAENSHIQPLTRWGDAYLRVVGDLARGS